MPLRAGATIAFATTPTASVTAAADKVSGDFATPIIAPAVAPPAAHALLQQDSVTFIGLQKGRPMMPSTIPVIQPSSDAKLKVMSEAMIQAMAESSRTHSFGISTTKHYKRAATIYHQKIIQILGSNESLAPKGLRYAEVTDATMKAAANRCSTNARLATIAHGPAADAPASDLAGECVSCMAVLLQSAAASSAATDTARPSEVYANAAAVSCEPSENASTEKWKRCTRPQLILYTQARNIQVH